MTSKAWRAAALLFALAAGCTSAPPLPAKTNISRPPSLEDDATRLAGRIFIDGRGMRDLRDLATNIGARQTGTPAYTRAAAWALDRFAEAGVPAKLEPFPIRASWRRGSASARVVSPIERVFPTSSAAWGRPTPPGGVRGEVVSLSEVAPEAISALSSSLRGRVVLLDMKAFFEGGFLPGTARVARAYAPLFEAGALAILWTTSRPGPIFKAHHHFHATDPISPLPVFDISKDDAASLREAMAKGPVIVELANDNEVGGPVEVANVIAEIRGREKPDECVVLGAHLDSWDLGPSVQDNGTGVVEVLEAARAMVALGRPPRRSIRFALWAAEEQGLLGSRAYAAAHEAELDHHIVVLNADDGAGEVRGFQVSERQDVALAMKPLCENLLAGLGGGISMEGTGNSDHASFWVRGVPVMNLWVDDSDYFQVHHMPTDTLEKVSPPRLASAAALLATTAWALAEQSGPFAPRLQRTDVEALLQKTNLLEAFRANGMLP